MAAALYSAESCIGFRWEPHGAQKTMYVYKLGSFWELGREKAGTFCVFLELYG